ncbi:helix-turn-helix domain-containing protein [Nocardia terpenica]|uniref:helix-turn-helix transcriptional regulator n=1 Tax=Nocardia terpenica TaxID=455432 RepID=UPI001895206C|nr:helix-turn-helix transcriptional regulator [Nocardia terpenica]MBF6059204.1 helix-turn-helix domain-containing protein [Nocardia terpenica]MBF6103257.1 helix-turn-helix domain-containing protein [Nocardia terpenica]MBF6110554.1 helix-turn-helix domain-containing protein [Nocardia terpenica]MBF6116685.1 helix-turn-helix domain-containing protein [Nocardia terpenica]
MSQHSVADLGSFLRARRARLQPGDVGLVSYGARRRVPGLRREELAQLAGVSVAYYTSLEQGQARNASAEVLDALARALRLDDDERAHLHDLAGAAPRIRRAAATKETVSPHLRQLLDAMDAVPAIVYGRYLDVLAWNGLGHALVGPHLPPEPADPPNHVRMLFLDPDYRNLFVHRESETRPAVAYLRLAAGRHPDDQRLAALVGELCVKSPEFAELWNDHEVRECTFGTKQFRHPAVGHFELSYQVLRLPDNPDQQLQLLSAAPESKAQTALHLLGSIAATEWTAPNSERAHEHSDQH